MYKTGPHSANITSVPFHILYANVKESATEAVDRYLAHTPNADKDTLAGVRYTGTSTAVTSFCKEHFLSAKYAWLMPQMLAEFGKMTPVRSVEGKTYSPLLTLAKNIGTDARLSGMYRLAMHSLRGDFVGLQYKDPGRNFCALVPLILAAFKKMQNIKYSEWQKDELHHIVDPKLYKAMNCDYIPTPEEVRESIDIGLVVKSGTKEGEARNPSSTFKLFGIGDTAVGKMPHLAQVMATQIWCAHPKNRTDMMILDPQDWDSTPNALVTGDIFKVEAKDTLTKYMGAMYTDKMPWEE